VDGEAFKRKLDEALCELNDDYTTERKHALKDPILEVIPIERFYRYMELKGKAGGQNKFPRVIRNSQFEEWKRFLEKGEL